jgi:hypothetical protein
MAKKQFMGSGRKYCYNMTADENWVLRCDVDPQTGKCTHKNCIRIPSSQVPQGIRKSHSIKKKARAAR